MQAPIVPLFAALSCSLASVLPGQQFAPSAKQHVPSAAQGARTVVAFDEDRDGDQDLMAGGEQLHLLRNNGTGVFTAEPWRWVTGDIEVLEAADFDGDGWLDVFVGRRFVTRSNQPYAEVLLSRGSLPRSLPATQPVEDAEAADFDGDGDIDLIVTGSLFLNQGYGTFVDASATHLPSAVGGAVDAGDADGDGDVDLLTGGQLLLNDGTGRLTNATAGRLPSRSNRYDAELRFTDVDGDGDLDILDQHRGGFGADVAILENDGTGAFLTVHIVTTTPGALLLIDDFDGDGDRDFANATDVWVNDGSGRFARQPAVAGTVPNLEMLASTDLDADGDPDLVGRWPFSGLGLLGNDGTAGFGVWTPSPTNDLTGAAMGDIDGDGDVDLVGGFGGTLLNDGDGRFMPITGASPQFRWWPTLVDLDGDGDLDLAGGEPAVPRVNIYHNDGQGGFTPVTSVGGGASYPTVAGGDLDGDGDQDLVVAGTWATIALNDGTGMAFSQRRQSWQIPQPSTIHLFDADGDGDLDVLVKYWAWYGCGLFLNDGSANFTDVTATHLPAYPWNGQRVNSFSLADVDGDGDDDLLAVIDPFGARLLINDGAGRFIDQTTPRLPTGLPTDGGGIFIDADTDGDPDIALTSSQGLIHLRNDGAGFFNETGRCGCAMPIMGRGYLATADVDRDGDADVVDLGYPTHIYVNLDRHVAAPFAARIGRSFRLELYSRPGYGSGGPAVAIVSAAALRSAISLPFGRLGVDPAVALGLPVAIPAAGRAVVEFALPSVPTLINQELHVQALIGAPALHLTNVIHETITP